MRKPGDPKRRAARSVRFGAPPPTPAAAAAPADPPADPVASSSLALGGGWSVARSAAAALLQAEQRAYGRALSRRLHAPAPRPWAVRGDVPYEAENCAFCAMVVVGGVRMHLPEKLFGRNWLELRHDSGLALTFEPMGALLSWAELSRAELDAQRGGGEGWSGKSAGRADRAAWEGGRWEREARLLRREEYDWTYRTAYRGALTPSTGGGGGGGCGGAGVVFWERFRPLCLSSATLGAAATPAEEAGSAAAQAEEWVELGEAGGIGEAELGPVVEESQTKLYEDYLHDLGLATLGLRFRRHERGWEARLRWWAVVNPSGTPHRGVPHARLCDTSYSCVVGAALRLERRVVEKSLSEAESGDGCWAEVASLDAERMEPALLPGLQYARRGSKKAHQDRTRTPCP